jgi:hypothetical protein
MIESPANPPNGPAAAALVSAAAGGFALGVCALGGDAFATLARAFSLWKPTGPLSGVTDAAILVWLVVWFVLSRRWARRELDLRRINRIAAALFIAGLLLTFPPFMDLLQGK